MNNPFEEHKRIEEKISFKYSLYPLENVAEVKRRSIKSKKHQDFQGKEALDVEKSKFSDYSIVASPHRERIGTKNRYLAFKDEICVYEKGPENSQICTDDLCTTGRGYFVINPGERILPEFLLVLLRSGYLNGQISSKSKGKSIALGIRSARELEIPLPPLVVQERIKLKWEEERARKEKSLAGESKLSSLFKELESLLQSGKDNEESILSKSEEGFYCSPEVLATIDNWSPAYIASSLESSEKIKGQQSLISLIPIEEIADITVGSSVPEKYRSSNGLPFYGSGNVLKGYFSGETLGCVPRRYMNNVVSGGALIESEDIAVCINGRKSLGKAAILYGEEGIINQSLARVRLKPKHNTRLNRFLLTCYFNTKDFHKKMYAKGRGSKNKYVGSDDLKEVLVPNVFHKWMDSQIISILNTYEDIVERLIEQEQRLKSDYEVARECVEKNLIKRN